MKRALILLIVIAACASSVRNATLSRSNIGSKYARQTGYFAACGARCDEETTRGGIRHDAILDEIVLAKVDDRASSADGLVAASATYDLDGDRQNETLVEITDERGATGNQSFVLYLSGAGCTRFAGMLFGESIGPLDSTHHGARDLGTYSDGGCAGMAGESDILIFDGTQYRVDPKQTVTCACPDDAAPPAKRDPRCPGPE